MLVAVTSILMMPVLCMSDLPMRHVSIVGRAWTQVLLLQICMQLCFGVQEKCQRQSKFHFMV